VLSFHGIDWVVAANRIMTLGAVWLFIYFAIRGSGNSKTERHERLAHMIEEVSDYAVIALDLNGEVLAWNQGAADIKGYNKAEEVEGRSFAMFYGAADQAAGHRARSLPEDRAPAQRERLGRALAGQRRHFLHRATNL
jgi:PAS domain S-box-containing protein